MKKHIIIGACVFILTLVSCFYFTGIETMEGETEYMEQLLLERTQEVEAQ